MNVFDKNMEEFFDVAVVEPVKVETFKAPAVSTGQTTPEELSQDLSDAYQQSKDNLQEIIDQGKEAMEEILNVAKAGQHPRAFEVYGTLLKNMVDANKELLNIQKQMRDMDKSKKETSKTSIDKAAIFVGSTAELSKMLKNGNE
jgi:hypothetical protein